MLMLNLLLPWAARLVCKHQEEANLDSLEIEQTPITVTSSCKCRVALVYYLTVLWMETLNQWPHLLSQKSWSIRFQDIGSPLLKTVFKIFRWLVLTSILVEYPRVRSMERVSMSTPTVTSSRVLSEMDWDMVRGHAYTSTEQSTKESGARTNLLEMGHYLAIQMKWSKLSLMLEPSLMVKLRSCLPMENFTRVILNRMLEMVQAIITIEMVIHMRVNG